MKLNNRQLLNELHRYPDNAEVEIVGKDYIPFEVADVSYSSKTNIIRIAVGDISFAELKKRGQQEEDLSSFKPLPTGTVIDGPEGVELKAPKCFIPHPDGSVTEIKVHDIKLGGPGIKK